MMTRKRTKVRNMPRNQQAAAMVAIRAQHGNRTPRAIAMDARQTARRTFDEDSDKLPLWKRQPGRYDVRGVDTKATATPAKAKEPEPKPTKPEDSIKIITNNMPDGYEIHKWSYTDSAGKHTVHAVIFEDKPAFGQNKTFDSLTDARKAAKEHASNERSRQRNIADRKQLEEKGYIGTPLKKEPEPIQKPPTEPTGFQADPTLIDRDLAMRAHSGTSWSPEKRGEQEIASFVDDVEHVRETLMQSTESVEELAIVDREMDKFQKGYAQKWNARMAAHSSCFSSMIAGPSKFPARKAEKASKAYDKRTAETIEYKKRAINAITKKLKEHRISAGGAEIAMMEKKLASAEADQTRMKAVNKILRSKKTSDDVKMLQLRDEFGMPEQLVHNLMNPDWGKPGYPAYKLTNNNANIKRMKERVTEMQAREDTPTTEITFAGGTIIDSNEDDRVQIFYDERPSPDMIKQLKGSGWRWAPSLGVWQRKRTPAAMTSAKQITGVR